MATLTIPFQYADSIPLVPEDGVLVYLIDAETGELFDGAGNLDTAISMINSTQYVGVAVADERHWCQVPADCYYCQTYGNIIRTQAEVQAACDHERRLVEDCFNLKVVAA